MKNIILFIIIAVAMLTGCGEKTAEDLEREKIEATLKPGQEYNSKCETKKTVVHEGKKMCLEIQNKILRELRKKQYEEDMRKIEGR